MRARTYPGLSTSRSLGDLLAHEIGVTSEPGVKILELTQKDLFVLIGSQGIYAHLNPEETGEIVSEFAVKDPGICCNIIHQKV